MAQFWVEINIDTLIMVVWRRYAIRDEASDDLFDYIERHYNPRLKPQRWVTSARPSLSGSLEDKCKCPEKQVKPRESMLTAQLLHQYP